MKVDKLVIKLAATRKKRRPVTKAIFLSNLLFSCLFLIAEMLTYPTSSTKINKEKTLTGNLSTTRSKKTTAGYIKERIFNKTFNFFAIGNLFC